MDRGGAPVAVVETERLLLRPWRISDAAFRRRLWAERDPRVPGHRRLGPDGRPTVAEMEDQLRAYEQVPAPGLLVVERRGAESDAGTGAPAGAAAAGVAGAGGGAVLGYCGLVPNSVGRPEEPELAYEFLRASWGHGCATEASRAVLDLARANGHRRLASTVREWNTASLRVLEKLGFTDTGEREHDDVHGDSILLTTTL